MAAKAAASKAVEVGQLPEPKGPAFSLLIQCVDEIDNTRRCRSTRHGSFPSETVGSAGRDGLR
jgi:hypothetical protein